MDETQKSPIIYIFYENAPVNIVKIKMDGIAGGILHRE